MNEREIKNRLDEIRELADDNLLWPVAITAGRRKEVKDLAAEARRQGADQLAQRAERLLEDLKEDANHSASEDGQALAAFLDPRSEEEKRAVTEEDLRKVLQARPYLQTPRAAQRLERMALRARKIGRPGVEGACWQRAAFAQLIGAAPPLRKVLSPLKTDAGRYAQAPDKHREDFARALFKLGVARIKRGSPRRAEVTFQGAVAHLGVLFGREKTPKRRKELAVVLRNLGAARLEQQKWPWAEAASEKEATHRRVLFKGEKTEEHLEDLAHTLHHLGIARLEQQKWPRAEAAFDEEADRRRELFEAKKREERRERLAGALYNLGQTRFAQQKWPGAETAFEKAATHRRVLFEGEATDERREELARALYNLGLVRAKLEKWAGAETAYEEASGRRRELFKSEETEERRKKLADALDNLGVVRTKQEKHGPSEETFGEEVGHWEALLEVKETEERREKLARGLYNLGSARLEQQEWPGAETAYERAAYHRRELFEGDSTEERREDLAHTLHHLGIARLEQQKWPGAESAHKEETDRRRELLESERTEERREKLAGALYNLGIARLEQQKWPGAETASERAADHRRKLFEGEKTQEHRKDLARALHHLGVARLKQQKWTETETAYEKVVGHRRKLFEAERTEERREDLADALNNLGLARLEQKKWSGAETAYERAAYHRRKLFEAEKTEEHREALAVALQNLGIARYNQDKLLPSEEAASEALDQTDEAEPNAWPGGRQYYEQVRWRSLEVLSKCSLQRAARTNRPSPSLLESARSYIEQALTEWEARRRELGTFEKLRRFRQRWDSLFETMREVALRQGDYEAALRWTSGMKARALTDLIATARRDTRQENGEAEGTPLTENLRAAELPSAETLLSNLTRAARAEEEGTRPLWISYGFFGRDRLVAFAVPLWMGGEGPGEEAPPIWAEQVRLPDDTIRRIFQAYRRAQWIEAEYLGLDPSPKSAVEQGLFDLEALEEEDEAKPEASEEDGELSSETGQEENGSSRTVEFEQDFGSVMGQAGAPRSGDSTYWEKATETLKELAARFDPKVKTRKAPPWFDEKVGGTALTEQKEVLAQAAREAGLDQEDWDVAPAAWPPLPEKELADGKEKRTKRNKLRKERRRFLEMQRAALKKWARREVGSRLIEPVVQRLLEGRVDLEESPPTELLIEPHGALHMMPLETAPARWPFGEEPSGGEPGREDSKEERAPEKTGPEKRPLTEQVPTYRVPSALMVPHLVDPHLTEEPEGEAGRPRGRGALVAEPPPGSGLLHPEEAEAAIEAAVGTENTTCLPGRTMRPSVLQEELQEEPPPQVVHLASHSQHVAEDPLSSQVQTAGDPITAEALLRGDYDLPGTGVVYLSSCESAYAEAGLGDELMGLIYAIQAAGARCVVGHLYPVTEEVARRQATAFYEAFGKGASAGAAYREATKAGREYCEGGGAPEAAREDWSGLVLFGDPSAKGPQMETA